MKILHCIRLSMVMILLSAGISFADNGEIIIIPVSDAIGPGIADFVSSGILPAYSRCLPAKGSSKIRVSDQLKAGEISFIETTPQESANAKARLDAFRAKRRERHAKKKQSH